ncbi:MAG: ATP-binding protein [Gammaproteobacteria bacterium]
MILKRRSKKRSIWLYYAISVGIVLAALLLVTWYVADRFRDFFIDHLQTVLEARAQSISLEIKEALPPAGMLAPYCLLYRETDPDIRVTVIDADGTVLCESVADAATMDNHGRRPEIMQAMNGRTGSVIRFSNTVSTYLLYVAVPLQRVDLRPWVVRTALPLSSIDGLLNEVFRKLLGVLIALIAAMFVVSLYVYRKINSPLKEIRQGAERFAQGRFEAQLPEYQMREISELAEAMNSMATRLDRLDNLRRDFVANVSHELKTPVTTVKGFVETLQEGAKENPDDLDRFLSIIARQTDRLAAIIDDLLTLSRLESAPRSEILELRVRPLRLVLESCREICRVRADAKEIDIFIECPPVITVYADHSLLTQAIVNLTDNAIKYSPEKSSVLLSGFDEEDGVRITVADNGPGIGEKYLPRLFERFYRVDKARSRKLGGTGLGLAIVKHIAIAHGGRVGVETRHGRGSTFSIFLPKPA